MIITTISSKVADTSCPLNYKYYLFFLNRSRFNHKAMTQVRNDAQTHKEILLYMYQVFSGLDEKVSYHIFITISTVSEASMINNNFTQISVFFTLCNYITKLLPIQIRSIWMKVLENIIIMVYCIKLQKYLCTEKLQILRILQNCVWSTTQEEWS